MAYEKKEEANVYSLRNLCVILKREKLVDSVGGWLQLS